MESGEKIPDMYNNRMNMMTIIFNYKTRVLKQEKMASGIKYTNKTYRKWHGIGILYKNDIKIFQGSVPAVN